MNVNYWTCDRARCTLTTESGVTAGWLVVTIETLTDAKSDRVAYLCREHAEGLNAYLAGAHRSGARS